MRSLLDAAYRRVRQVDSGIDARLGTADLAAFAGAKAVQRGRALSGPAAPPRSPCTWHPFAGLDPSIR